VVGIILAGGNGTRLRPLTYVANKHLLPVYNKPMIHYPIQTLKDMGCDEIVIVSGGENIGGFAELLKDGSEFGVRFTYRVQNASDGVAGALLCAEGLAEGVFPVILGDNYFDKAPLFRGQPCVYLKQVSDPERFGVYENGKIIEKPQNPKSNKAVTGLYVYDDDVFDYIKTLAPSGRGELEITDVNNWYLKQGCSAINYDGYWSDMGTFDLLIEVANKLWVK
jgi:glucose-1-phosphate thymidylyltransferase